MHRLSLLIGLTAPALLLTACATVEPEPTDTPAATPEAAPAAAPAPAETPVAAAPAPTATPAETPAVAGMTSAPPAPIAALHPQFVAAWQGADGDAVAAFYADDAVVVAGDGTTFTGRTEILNGWITPNLEAMSDFQATPTSFEMTGDRITEQGRYSFRQTMEGETEMVAGRYEDVWERQPDGRWLVVSTRVMDEG